MKVLYLLVAINLLACNGREQNNESQSDTVFVEHPSDSMDKKATFPGKEKEQGENDPSSTAKTYSNERFKEVTVEKTSTNKYNIKGKAQVFEASFSWVVEDGHNELKEGHEMTDAGAPEWGNFNFTVAVEKQQPNSTLILILFEGSPKDGSRQYELPIVLE